MRLHELVVAGDLAGVGQILAKARPPINLQDARGCTPLSHACQHGHFEIAKLLLNAGASPGVLERDNVSLLHHAKTADIALLLLDCGLDVTGGSCRTSPLEAACGGDDCGVVEILLDAGATPSHAALLNAVTRPNMVEALLKAGVEPGGIALHFAVRERVLETVELLIDANADIDHIVGFRSGNRTQEETPLHVACRSGHPLIATLLLERGADSSLLDSDGYAPLHVAIQKSHTETIKALLMGGVNRYIETAQGEAPADLTTAPGIHALLNPPVKRAG